MGIQKPLATASRKAFWNSTELQLLVCNC